jgi:trehalose-6-phosphate synthase
MNLVAKEYIAARNNLRGVLLLSQFTGAARELQDAILINPFDRESFADAIKQALSMNDEEQRSKLSVMREYLSERNIFHWASAFVTELTKVQGGAGNEALAAKVFV